ncbi:hypothetical protein MTP99_006205 [Tenebrio molitor]|nr:hypothetical protein MTP99_006205 [Tenebrio molitor]
MDLALEAFTYVSTREKDDHRCGGDGEGVSRAPNTIRWSSSSGKNRRPYRIRGTPPATAACAGTTSWGESCGKRCEFGTALTGSARRKRGKTRRPTKFPPRFSPLY